MVSSIDSCSDVRNRVLIFDSLVPKKIDADVKRQICAFTRPMSETRLCFMW